MVLRLKGIDDIGRDRRTRTALLFLLFTFHIHGQSGHVPPADAQESAATLHIDVTELEVGCIAEDAHGVPVAGLRAADFAVSIDGVPAAVRTVGTDASVPIHLALLIDVSLSQKNMRRNYAKALMTIGAHLRPGRDAVSVYSFAGAVRLVRDWDNVSQLSAVDVAGIHPESGEVLQKRPPPMRGGTLLFDAVSQAANRFRGIEGRKAILVLTDGVDVGSTANSTDALRLASDQGVSVSALEFGTDPVGVVSPFFLAKKMHDALADDAQKTGGVLLHARAGQEDVQIDSIIDALKQAYLLYIASPTLQPGKHTVSLSMRPAGNGVRLFYPETVKKN